MSRQRKSECIVLRHTPRFNPVVGGIDAQLGIEIDPVAGAFDAPGELRVLVAGQRPGDAPGD